MGMIRLFPIDGSTQKLHDKDWIMQPRTKEGIGFRENHSRWGGMKGQDQEEKRIFLEGTIDNIAITGIVMTITADNTTNTETTDMRVAVYTIEEKLRTF